MSDEMSAAEYVASQRRGSKYRNQRVRIGIKTFASKAEGARYLELLALQRAGAIEDLRCQKRFPIAINSVTVMTYVADFTYWDVEHEVAVIEDVKGGDYRTAMYKLKKRCFEAAYHREITEVSGIDTRGMDQYLIEEATR